MESSSTSSGVGSRGADSQTNRTELESNSQGRKPKLLARVRRVSISLLKDYLLSDLFKKVACLMTALCIFQFVWIQHIQAGIVRIPNDRFDVTFGENIDRNSPKIWDNDRQSFIHNAIPVPVHSHNDYTRRIPLFEALGSGCISIEADVHLRNSDLLVGHNSRGLHRDSTLRSMYLEPLQRMLEMRNVHNTNGTWRGIFDRAPQQTVVLLIDHKSAGPETFAELDSQLQPLRDLDYLTYWNGSERVVRPLTIVASGNAPFESVMALNETHRDIFWDAKLDLLISVNDNFDAETPIYAYNRSNSYLASTEFKHARLYSSPRELSHLPSSPGLKDLQSTQIEQAKARGLIARYWDTPTSPPNLRDIAWRVLVDLEVGVLNVDDLGAVRARASGWGKIQM